MKETTLDREVLFYLGKLNLVVLQEVNLLGILDLSTRGPRKLEISTKSLLAWARVINALVERPHILHQKLRIESCRFSWGTNNNYNHPFETGMALRRTFFA